MADQRILAVARGDAPGDILFSGGRLLNVFTGRVEEASFVVAGGRIAGVGGGYQAQERVSLGGRFVVPGLIDAHVHIESSLVTPPEFARAVVPRGTTTVVTDPHEIANVHGLEGIRYMLDASEGLPLDVRVMASSCVPATPMATTGAALDADVLVPLLDHERVLGLAEVMNYPGVIRGDPEVHAKLERFASRPVDGHAPMVRGPALNAYIAAGPGSDHEATSAEEVLEKVARGLWVFLREATAAKNLLDLAPAITPATMRRLCLCTDDRQPRDLLEEGGIDHMIRLLIGAGVPPVSAVTMATLNPAEYFGLKDRGAVAPGRRADFAVVRELEDFVVDEAFSGGQLVAAGGAVTWPAPASPNPPRPAMSIPWDRVCLAIPHRRAEARVIVAVPGQLITRCLHAVPKESEGLAVSDPGRDILKMAVIDRYSGSARTGIGFVKGLGLKRGAIAGTVAHDHHNIIVAGTDDHGMMTAARRVASRGGGLAAAEGTRVLAALDLPVGGLMSRDPIEDVARDVEGLLAAARALGSTLHDPFMALSFLGLEVIPTLKLTDHGLIDVDNFEKVPLWV